MVYTKIQLLIKINNQSNEKLKFWSLAMAPTQLLLMFPSVNAIWNLFL
jgi:hypothetical protein